MKHNSGITSVKRPQLACPTKLATEKGEELASLENLLNIAKLTEKLG